MSRVELVKASWSGVRFEGSQLGEALIEGGRLELRFDGSTVDSLDCERAEATVEGDESTIDLWDLERATIRCTAGRELVVKELLMRASTLTLEEGDGHRAVPSVFGRAKVADSCLKILGSVAPRILEAVGSLIVYGATENVAGDWRIRKSVLLVSSGPAWNSECEDPLDTGVSIDRWSVVLAPEGVPQSLLESAAGTFGAIAPELGPETLVPARSWGVVEGGGVLDALGVSSREPGCRAGGLLVVSKQRYRELLAGDLDAVGELRKLAVRSLDMADPKSAKRIDRLRRRARTQHKALLEREWPDFEDYAATWG